MEHLVGEGFCEATCLRGLTRSLEGSHSFRRRQNSPDLVEAMRKVGVESFVQSSPKAFGEFLQKETDRWGIVARASGAKSD